MNLPNERPFISYIRLFYLLSIILIQISCSHSVQETPLSPETKTTTVQIGSFFSFQERMNWKMAVQKCTEQKMRLPSREELISVYRSDQRNDWIQEGPTYWTSDEKSRENAFYINMKTGYTGYLFKSFPYSVKCTRP